MEKRTRKINSLATFRVKNMSCDCCIRVLHDDLEKTGVTVAEIKLGKVSVSYDPSRFTVKKIEKRIEEIGFPVIRDKEKIIVEEMKIAMKDMVQNTTYNAMIRNSDYLVERFGLSYPYLSGLFSKHEGTTLEKYIISLKIEKAKELIEGGELTLSEIAYMMGYSSVQYLSTQFRTVTGISVSGYKSQDGQL
jgi:AraC family transcriptional regulator